jgi:ADP-heptose:LPS heptosyltransferase
VLIVLAKPFAKLVGLILRRDHDPRPRGEILVIKLLGGGSLVLAAPALLGIKRAYPALCLSVLTTRGGAPFAHLLGLFDRIHILDDRSLPRLMLSALRVWPRTVRVDTTIDLEVYSRLSTMWSLATLARNRIGFYLESVFWRRNLHTHLLFFNRSSGVHLFYGHVARMLGVTPASREQCAERLLSRCPPVAPRGTGRPRVAIGHACSELGRERMLAPDQWRTILAKHPTLGGAEVHLVGSADDRREAEAIVKACAPSLPGSEWHVRCGELSLAESVALLAACDEFVGIDSALLHLARLLGLPTTSFWGPTDPSTRLQAFPGARDRVHYARISCSPCIHVAEEPPCRGHNVCMAALDTPTPETVDPMWVIDYGPSSPSPSS